MSGEPLDDRYEWINITTYGGVEIHVRGRCLHRSIEPVYAHDGLERHKVAVLCTCCDQAWDLEGGALS